MRQVFRVSALVPRGGVVEETSRDGTELLDRLGTATAGATGLQPAVPLVCRPGDGCAGLGCQPVQQESRPGRLTCPTTYAIGCRSWNARLRPEPPRRQREFAKLVCSLQQ